MNIADDVTRTLSRNHTVALTREERVIKHITQATKRMTDRRLRQVQQEAPGGRGDVSGAEQSVRTIATVQSAAELANLDLPLADGRHIRLGDVAQVLDTVSEPRALATLARELGTLEQNRRLINAVLGAAQLQGSPLRLGVGAIGIGEFQP